MGKIVWVQLKDGINGLGRSVAWLEQLGAGRKWEWVGRVMGENAEIPVGLGNPHLMLILVSYCNF